MFDNFDRDQQSKELGAFGMLINALGGGGDIGQSFPQSDSNDLMNRARFIPGEVTMARRRGEKVTFVQNCGQCCWYWQMPDGTRIYHWERGTYEAIRKHNMEKDSWVNKLVRRVFKIKEDSCSAGPCPHCGNVHTNGGTVKL